MSLTVYLATLNDHKIHEVSKILARRRTPLPHGGFELRTAASLNLPGEWQETGTTFADNARIKVDYLRAHLPAELKDRQDIAILGEDSGICVTALDDAPGIYSKRYCAGDHADQDAANNAKLLAALQGQTDRRAYYVCALAWWQPGKERQPGREVQVFIGESHGTIATESRGSGGFGYDPLFIPKGYSQTFGELSEEHKLTMSHRFYGINAWLDALADS